MSGLWDQKGIPHNGWKFLDMEDLEDDRIFCQMCRGVKIRYAHSLRHPNYPETLVVGCECAAKMESDYTLAKSREKKFINILKRKKKWLSRNWRHSSNGNDYINTDGFNIVIFQKGSHWTGRLKNKDTECIYSLNYYNTQDDAKRAAFDRLIELKDHYFY
ncbi:MAG: hypothetical protein WCG23_10200 [bacterium]